ncbi:MAG: 3-hydroxyacyl-CoA dehydrogenase NAD-binding domain-containing protein [Balneolaceae bacterium]
MSLSQSTKIGIAGAGTMGTGIAQIAASMGHTVYLFDPFSDQLKKSREGLLQILERQIEKERMTRDQVDRLISNIHHVDHINDFADCGLVLEAIIEDLRTKKDQFARIEAIVSKQCILATNTSSLSIASISSALKKPDRFLGIHFFNPAPIMQLVEIIPGISTDPDIVTSTRKLINEWDKTTVIAKDTPGFIVNRVARPFYGEALRIYEEGIADPPTIDWAMKELGGFRMGPFELMDLIGHDVNYAVTESVFKAFYYDPRFKPSFAQKRLVEAERFGLKSGIGFYNYGKNASNPQPNMDRQLGEIILNRILVMLINEAADAVFMNVATVRDVDLAMTKGVNYPKGLLKWADEWGSEMVLKQLNELFNLYGEDRYRPNPLIKKKASTGTLFHE